jgi:hypothetical protein
MNTFLQQAADDLRTARADVQVLDTFFGTPGLMN